LNAGIVDQHIEPAELVESHADHFGYRVRFRHVCPRISDGHAEIGDDRVLGGRNLLGLAEAVEDNGGTRSGKGAGDAESDTAGRAGDQGDFALQM
jgi:hypothetical protein